MTLAVISITLSLDSDLVRPKLALSFTSNALQLSPSRLALKIFNHPHGLKANGINL